MMIEKVSFVERLRAWLHNEREAVAAVSTTFADNASSLAEVLGMLFMPLIPASLTGLSLYFTVAQTATNPNGWDPTATAVIAVMTIVGLESLGIAASKTAMRLYHAWRDNLSLGGEVLVSLVTVVMYTGLVTAINLWGTAMPDELRWIGSVAAPLAVAMYVVVGFNADLQRRRDETLIARQQRVDFENERALAELQRDKDLLALQVKQATRTLGLKLRMKEERQRAKIRRDYGPEGEPPAPRFSGEEAREEARKILEEQPGISGAELGRLLGMSARSGQMILKELAE